jgi:3-hydroxyisobutyrate dehydrogenase-like beta-hydroxyacid dehydrogenase
VEDPLARRPVGVVGLGAMGAAAVRQLVRRGVMTRCFDVDEQRTRALTDLSGVTACSSAADAALGCDAILTFLPTSEAVRSVAAQVLPAMAQHSHLLDMSTCEPDLARDVDRMFRRHGRRFVDCPVSRKAPSSSIFVGGDAGDLRGVAPLLDCLGTTVVYCGNVGAGYLTKALHQYVKYARFDVALRAMLFGEAHGVPIDVVSKALLSGTAADAGLGTAEDAVGPTAGGRTHAPARIIKKDLGIVADMFAAAGHGDPIATHLNEFWAAVCDAGYADRPYTSIIDYLRGPDGATQE